MNPLRIATMAGSLRLESYNRKLLRLAEQILVRSNVEVDRLDLRDFPLPLYDGDVERESGLPPVVWTLKARIAAAQGIVIACPEYNSGIPGVFKNVLDWTSRGESQPWAGKVVGLMGATTGMWGTQRMMPQLRQTFVFLGAQVAPRQVNVREAGTVWDAEGNLLDPKLPATVEKFVQEFLELVKRLRLNSVSE